MSGAKQHMRGVMNSLPEAADVSTWHVEGIRLSAAARRRRRAEARAGEPKQVPPDTTEDGERLTQRLTIAKAVEVYRTQTGRIAAAFAEIQSAEEELNAAFCAGERYRGMHVPTRHNLSFAEPHQTLKEIRKQAWECLVDLLEVRRMMSIKRANELDEMLKNDEMPELTEENAASMVRGFEANLETMLREAVEEVFNWLRPPGSRYKTNTELEIGERVVLTWMVDSGYGRAPFRVNYQRDAHLTALENVFTALDGKGQITKTHRSALSNAINECDADGKGETPYFSFRCFKNRNMHLRFKRLDLLERLNAIAGGMRLRPAKASAPTRKPEKGLSKSH